MGGGATFGGYTDPLNTNPTTKITNNTFLSHHYHLDHSYCNVNLPLISPANSCSMKFDSCGSCYESVFGSPPSQIEVEKAIDDLHRLMVRFSASDSECNGLQQMLYHDNPRMRRSFGYRRIYDAYHMLQTEPPVQRMVISISSDKAVWDAIVNNKAVQDLQGSLHTAREEKFESSNEDLDLASLLLKWILGITKSKVVELVGKFGLLVNEIFNPADQEEKPTSELNNLLEEKVRSSLLLSVVILLIVVFARTHEA